MRLTADTSVIVAAFASWHEHHTRAVEAIEQIELVVGPCLLETYSVLTRLPPPHRIAPDVVADYLRMAFGSHEVVTLPARELSKLIALGAAHRLPGGAIYDAAIGAAAHRFKARLLTLDARARPTYAAVGVAHELLA